MSAGMDAVGVGPCHDIGVSSPVLWWERRPDQAACGFLPYSCCAVFFSRFIPCDFVVVNTAPDVQPFFLCVVHGKSPVWFGRFCVWRCM